MWIFYTVAFSSPPLLWPQFPMCSTNENSRRKWIWLHNLKHCSKRLPHLHLKKIFSRINNCMHETSINVGGMADVGSKTISNIFAGNSFNFTQFYHNFSCVQSRTCLEWQLQTTSIKQHSKALTFELFLYIYFLIYIFLISYYESCWCIIHVMHNL
jgi:hypothetical protein